MLLPPYTCQPHAECRPILTAQWVCAGHPDHSLHTTRVSRQRGDSEPPQRRASLCLALALAPCKPAAADWRHKQLLVCCGDSAALASRCLCCWRSLPWRRSPRRSARTRARWAAVHAASAAHAWPHCRAWRWSVHCTAAPSGTHPAGSAGAAEVGHPTRLHCHPKIGCEHLVCCSVKRPATTRHGLTVLCVRSQPGGCLLQASSAQSLRWRMLGADVHCPHRSASSATWNALTLSCLPRTRKSWTPSASR